MSRGPRFVLAVGGLALALLGAGLLTYDVFTQVQRGSGWLPLIAGSIGLLIAGLWRGVEGSAQAPPPDVVEPSPSAEQPEVAPVRAPQRREVRWIATGASLVLLALALIPLRYYLGDDPYDERFSWRMFSGVRMQRCDIRASETVNGESRPVRLMATVQAGWVETLRRNREAVMERYLRWRCGEEGVERARLENQCVTPDGEEVPTIVREIDCASGDITREGGLR